MCAVGFAVGVRANLVEFVHLRVYVEDCASTAAGAEPSQGVSSNPVLDDLEKQFETSRMHTHLARGVSCACGVFLIHFHWVEEHLRVQR